MLFRDSYVTNAGVELLARLTSQQGKLIWTRAATSSNSDVETYTTAEMNSITDSNFGTYTSSGAVTNAIISDTKDVVTIFSELSNKEYNGEACLFGAWAKLDGDINETLIIVARCGEGVTPTVISPFSAGLEKIFVNFAIEINTTQVEAIEISEENYYATNAALEAEQKEREKLNDRLVTTHLPTSNYEGDNQDIYGVKSFYTGIELVGPNVPLSFSNTSNQTISTKLTGNASGVKITLENDKDSITAGEHALLITDVNNQYLLNLYKSYFDNSWFLYVDKIIPNTVMTDLIMPIDIIENNKITFMGNIIPSEDETYSIGSESKTIETVFTTNLKVNAIDGYYDYVAFSKDIIPNDTGIKLGRSDSIFAEVHANKYYKGTKEGFLASKLEVSGTTVNVPLGGLILVAGQNVSGTVNVGQEMTIDANSVHPVKSTTGNTFVPDNDKYILAGKYQAISGISGNQVIALLMRVG